MQRLAIYFDVGTEMWRPEEDWGALPPGSWDDYFQPGIGSHSPDTPRAPRAYILQPIDSQLMYLRRGPNVRQEDSQAFQEAEVQIDAVSLEITSKRSGLLSIGLLCLSAIFKLLLLKAPKWYCCVY